MEDKRTLVAFLLLGVILLLWPYYNEWVGLGPEPAEEAPEPAPAEIEREGGAEGTASESKGVGSAGAAAEDWVAEVPVAGEPASRDFVAREVVVQTPLQEVRVSTRGGVVSSCELEEYRSEGGERVELLSAGSVGLIAAVGGSAGIERLEGAEFVPDKDRLIVGKGETGELELVADLGGGRGVWKRLRFDGDGYGIDYQVGFSGFGEDVIGYVLWDGGLAITEEAAAMDLREARALTLFNGSLSKVQVEDADEEDEWSERGAVQWVGVRSKYFLAAYVPGGEEERLRVKLEGQGRGGGEVARYGFRLGRRLGGDPSLSGVMYLGPLDLDTLSGYGADLERSIDFGWPVVRQISRFLLVVFKKTYEYVPNYGFIIILFAVAIKVLVYPLTHKTYESTAKMQALQPKIAALREKYKNDQQKLSQETMRLYKEEGVNPLGGCLPLVFQMPIFFALYSLFGRTIELRQAPFVLWIDDLSVPDEIMVAGLGLHVLPVLMGASMLIQQKMTMKDPKQAFLVYFMPVMMVAIFWRMSSGLVLYWTVFNVLTIAQQLLITKKRQEGA